MNDPCCLSLSVPVLDSVLWSEHRSRCTIGSLDDEGIRGRITFCCTPWVMKSLLVVNVVLPINLLVALRLKIDHAACRIALRLARMKVRSRGTRIARVLDDHPRPFRRFVLVVATMAARVVTQPVV